MGENHSDQWRAVKKKRVLLRTVLLVEKRRTSARVEKSKNKGGGGSEATKLKHAGALEPQPPSTLGDRTTQMLPTLRGSTTTVRSKAERYGERGSIYEYVPLVGAWDAGTAAQLHNALNEESIRSSLSLFGHDLCQIDRCWGTEGAAGR